MRIVMVMALFVFLAVNAYADGFDILGVEIDHKERMNLVCPCEFNESIPSAIEGFYGSGPMVLLVADNEKKPYALINISGEVVKLQPAPYTPYECNIGEKYRRAWQAGKISVKTDLISRQLGAEACWFKGLLKVSTPNGEKTIPIKGACGC